MVKTVKESFLNAFISFSYMLKLSLLIVKWPETVSCLHVCNHVENPAVVLKNTVAYEKYFQHFNDILLAIFFFLLYGIRLIVSRKKLKNVRLYNEGIIKHKKKHLYLIV